MNPQSYIPYWIGGILLIILALGAYFFFFSRDSLNFTGAQESPSVCTMDVKLCPDGSYVSRVAPSCAFATCPSTIPTDTPSGEPGFDVKG